MCRYAGLRIKVLPAYHPDFNPSQASLATLKRWMKKNWQVADAFLVAGDYGGSVHLAVSKVQRALDSGAHFRTAGWPYIIYSIFKLVVP